MNFYPEFNEAIFEKRYKRFLTDITQPNGATLTIHCPNTGSMRNCAVPGTPCWYSISDNKKRKYAQTLEITTTPSGHLAGVNTGRANKLVAEAIENGVITELSGYSDLKAEVKCEDFESRLDFRLRDHSADNRDCFVEVKSVTLMDGESNGEGFFPDSVSVRGSKHLQALMGLVDQGHRAVIFYCVQHSGIETVSPADHIDEEYGKWLRKAVAKGVEAIAYKAVISPSEITLVQRIPVVIP